MHFYNVYVTSAPHGHREHRVPASSMRIAIGVALAGLERRKQLPKDTVEVSAVLESPTPCFSAKLVPHLEDGTRFGGYADAPWATDYATGLLRRACEHRDRFPRDSKVAYVQVWTKTGRVLADTRTGIVK